MNRPFNGVCPYCDERMVLGLHASSWVIGILAGIACMTLTAALIAMKL